MKTVGKIILQSAALIIVKIVGEDCRVNHSEYGRVNSVKTVMLILAKTTCRVSHFDDCLKLMTLVIV